MSQTAPQSPARKDYRVFVHGRPTEPGAYWIQTPPKNGKTLRQSLCLVVEIQPGQLGFMLAGQQRVALMDKLHPQTSHCPLYGLGENIALKRDAMSQAIANCLLVASADREALLYLMHQFDGETHVCKRCGFDEATDDCDSAIYLRDHLQNLPGVPASWPTNGSVRHYRGEIDSAHFALDRYNVLPLSAHSCARSVPEALTDRISLLAARAKDWHDRYLEIYQSNAAADEALTALGIDECFLNDEKASEPVTLKNRIRLLDFRRHTLSLELEAAQGVIEEAHAKLTELAISKKGAPLPDGGWTLCPLPERIAELKYQTEQRCGNHAEISKELTDAHASLNALGVRRFANPYGIEPPQPLTLAERIALMDTHDGTAPVDLG